jgi:hypothetical protein
MISSLSMTPLFNTFNNKINEKVIAFHVYI